MPVTDQTGLDLIKELFSSVAGMLGADERTVDRLSPSAQKRKQENQDAMLRTFAPEVVKGFIGGQYDEDQLVNFFAEAGKPELGRQAVSFLGGPAQEHKQRMAWQEQQSTIQPKTGLGPLSPGAMGAIGLEAPTRQSLSPEAVQRLKGMTPNQLSEAGEQETIRRDVLAGQEGLQQRMERVGQGLSAPDVPKNLKDMAIEEIAITRGPSMANTVLNARLSRLPSAKEGQTEAARSAATRAALASATEEAHLEERYEAWAKENPFTNAKSEEDRARWFKKANRFASLRNKHSLNYVRNQFIAKSMTPQAAVDYLNNQQLVIGTDGQLYTRESIALKKATIDVENTSFWRSLVGGEPQVSSVPSGESYSPVSALKDADGNPVFILASDSITAEGFRQYEVGVPDTDNPGQYITFGSERTPGEKKLATIRTASGAKPRGTDATGDPLQKGASRAQVFSESDREKVTSASNELLNDVAIFASPMEQERFNLQGDVDMQRFEDLVEQQTEKSGRLSDKVGRQMLNRLEHKMGKLKYPDAVMLAILRKRFPIQASPRPQSTP